jgi:hypothetical protein
MGAKPDSEVFFNPGAESVPYHKFLFRGQSQIQRILIEGQKQIQRFFIRRQNQRFCIPGEEPDPDVSSFLQSQTQLRSR